MKQGPYFCRFPLRFQFKTPKIALTFALSREVVDIVPTQGPFLLQLLLPRMLGAAARGEDAAQALDAQHQVCSFLALPYLHPPHILPFSLATACVTFAVGYSTAALVVLRLILGV